MKHGPRSLARAEGGLPRPVGVSVSENGGKQLGGGEEDTVVTSVSAKSMIWTTYYTNLNGKKILGQVSLASVL